MDALNFVPESTHSSYVDTTYRRNVGECVMTAAVEKISDIVDKIPFFCFQDHNDEWYENSSNEWYENACTGLTYSACIGIAFVAGGALINYFRPTLSMGILTAATVVLIAGMAKDCMPKL